MLAFNLTLAAGARHGALRAAASLGQGVTLLTGPSGAGKSTLLSLLAGALPPQSGSISFGGTRWVSEGRTIVEAHQRGIGWQPQAPSLHPHWSANEHLRMSARFRPPLADVQTRAIRELELSELLDRPAATLSAGEAQRVALLRALTACRGLLLLDEPITALQPALSGRAVRLVEELTAERGWTTLLVSHQPVALLRVSSALQMEAGLLRQA